MGLFISLSFLYEQMVDSYIEKYSVMCVCVRGVHGQKYIIEMSWTYTCETRLNSTVCHASNRWNRRKIVFHYRGTLTVHLFTREQIRRGGVQIGEWLQYLHHRDVVRQFICIEYVDKCGWMDAVYLDTLCRGWWTWSERTKSLWSPMLFDTHTHRVRCGKMNDDQHTCR